MMEAHPSAAHLVQELWPKDLHQQGPQGRADQDADHAWQIRRRVRRHVSLQISMRIRMQDTADGSPVAVAAAEVRGWQTGGRDAGEGHVKVCVCICVCLGGG
jgi:hypothetical protein